MEQEGVGALAHQFVDVLRITVRYPESRWPSRLRFATGEQRGTVSTRQNAGTNVQTTGSYLFHGHRPRLAGQCGWAVF
ncbi:hypothetical protein MJ579_25465 [Klebsiella pneumoniae]|nr:hypothetical protein MJ579_25465 [Klebsiella pneumoniae]